MGWTVRGSNPGRDKRLFSKHQTSSGAHPTSYLMGTRGNFPRAGMWGLAATLNVSSPEVKNKWSYTSTAPPDLHFMDRATLPLLPVLLSTA